MPPNPCDFPTPMCSVYSYNNNYVLVFTYLIKLIKNWDGVYRINFYKYFEIITKISKVAPTKQIATFTVSGFDSLRCNQTRC